jgi:hypothetical protein
MSADPYAYLKWPRLIVFNLNGALSIVATGLAAQSLVNVNHDKAQLVRLSSVVSPHFPLNSKLTIRLL